MLAGSISSGPFALWLVAVTHPQPRWQDASTFVGAFHRVQLLPYVFGIVLIGGFVLLVAALHRSADGRWRSRTTVGVMCAAAFAAMIATNYAIQTTLVPALVRRFTSADGPLIAALAMASPDSLGWTLEMWGYGVIGVATWLVAPVLRQFHGGRIAAALCVANGAISLAGTALTVAAPGWVLTTSGLLLFGAWNVLVAALAIAVIRAARSPAPPAQARLALSTTIGAPRDARRVASTQP